MPCLSCSLSLSLSCLSLCLSLSSKRTSDLHAVADHGGGDDLHGRHVLQQLVIGSLLEQHSVVELQKGERGEGKCE